MSVKWEAGMHERKKERKKDRKKERKKERKKGKRASIGRVLTTENRETWLAQTSWGLSKWTKAEVEGLRNTQEREGWRMEGIVIKRTWRAEQGEETKKSVWVTRGVQLSMLDTQKIVSRFEHKHEMLTELEKLKLVQSTAAISTFRRLYITWELHQWSVCSVKCLACVQSIVWYAHIQPKKETSKPYESINWNMILYYWW